MSHLRVIVRYRMTHSKACVCARLLVSRMSTLSSKKRSSAGSVRDRL